MPTLETEIGSSRIADEVIIVNSLQCLWTEPSILFSIQISERLGSVQHLSISVENALEVSVDFGNAEESPSMFVVQEVNDHRVEGNPD